MSPRFSGRHCARATSQRSTWPLERYYPRLRLIHQSWVMQRSQIQRLGLNVVSFSHNKDNHSAKVPMALTHLWWFEGNLSSSTLGLDHPWSLIPGHSLRPPSSCHSPEQQRQLGCSFTFQQLLQEEWWGRVSSGEVGIKWGAMRGWDGPRRGQVGDDLLSSLWPWAGLIQASPLCFLYPLGLSRAELPASSCTH